MSGTPGWSRRWSAATAAALAVAVGGACGPPPLPPAGGTTVPVSVDSGGVPAPQGSHSTGALISADGKTIVFNSNAPTLVPGDTNGAVDAFAHDPATGETSRVSVSSGGGQAGSGASATAVSGNGRYVVLQSAGADLAPGDTNGASDVFVHDRSSGGTTLASVAGDGSPADGPSEAGVISATGTLVAFVSEAGNLVPGDTNGEVDVFVRDLTTGRTVRVSVASDGAQADRSAWEPAISADGRFVAFRSSATNLVPGDTNDMGDVFVHDGATGETTRVSVASDATEGDSGSGTPAISADGRFVAFHSSAATLVSDDTNLDLDVFVHDRVTGETTRVSVSSDGQQADEAAWVPSISADGRHISFQSRARTLVGDTDAGSTSDVFVHDRTTRRTRLVSVTSDGVQANGDSSISSAAMSAVGDRITFSSGATNLWPSDPGWPPSLATAVFLHTPAAA